jgi:hypothetical protein
MRLGRVAAASVDGDFERIGRRHHRPFADGEIAHRQAWLVVHPEHLSDAEFFHHAVVDHGQRTGPALFGRLEDHCDRAFEIAGFGQILGGAEQHGRVSVMAARMRLAGGLRSPGLARGFQDRQRVHIGAEPDHRPLPLITLDDADHAGAADAGLHDIAAKGSELVGDEGGRVVDVVEQLRVLVKMAPPLRNLILHFGDAIDDRHDVTSLSF